MGIFATNGVKVRRSKLFVPCVVLFPVFSMANHSCICSAMYNAEFRPTADNFSIQLRAQSNMRRGHQISIRYLDLFLTTTQRKKISLEKWNFVCQCPRFECRTKADDSIRHFQRAALATLGFFTEII